MLIDHAINSIAFVTGRLEEKKQNVLLDQIMGNKMTYMPDIIYDRKRGFKVRKLQARFMTACTTQTDIRKNLDGPLTVAIVKDTELLSLGQRITNFEIDLKVYVSRTDPYPCLTSFDFMFNLGADTLL